MNVDRQPARSALSHWRTALLASSTLARIGLSAVMVSGGLALVLIAAAPPALADGGKGGSGAAGGTGYSAGAGASIGGGGGAGGGPGGEASFVIPGGAGVGGSVLSPNGEDGSSFLGGNGGGGGGYHGYGGIVGSPSLPGGAFTFLGGKGGNGGSGGIQADGGGGGAGGYGALLSGTGIFTIDSGNSITGGNGGAGGNGGNGTVSSVNGANGGGGGDGGLGAFFVDPGAVLINHGLIQGGAGGARGIGGLAFPGGTNGANGAVGLGGVGVSGANLTVINSGTIAGGLSGFGVQANAITFTGGSNVLELQAGSNISGNVVGTGSDTFRLGGSGTASFDVSKIGAAAQYQGFNAFEKTGAGTWTLTGTPTQATTPWTLTGGTLVIGPTGTPLGSGTLTLNGGTLQASGGNVGFNNAVQITSAGGILDAATNILTLHGNIDDGVGGGSGTLTVAATGGVSNVVLSGNNTYSAATHVMASANLLAGSSTAFSANSAYTVDGSLVLAGYNNSVGSLSGGGLVINSNAAPATLTVSPTSGTSTFSGSLQDGGSGALSLVKTGAGKQILSGINTYTGTTTVSGGTLSVNGSIASSSLTTVNAGGTLGGNGTVGNTMIDGGTLAPGNSIGALTVAGNLVLTAASTYLVEVDPTSSDFTHVTGTANLGGARVNAVFAPGSYVEKRYTILTADGGLNGTAFSGPTYTNLPANFTTSLDRDANNAYLDLKLGFVMPGGINVNQQNVANTLVNFFNSTGGIPLAFGALDPRGLSQASGEIGTTASQAAFDAQSQFLNVLTDPFTGGQSAEAPSSSSALGYAAAPRGGKPHDAFASLATKAPPMQSFEQRWHLFGTVYGGNAQIGGNASLGSHDATSRVYGMIAGAAYAFSPATHLGFALGGGGTSFGLSDGLGSGRSDMFQAGVFARHGFAQGGYLSGALAYGWHDVSTDRTAPTGEQLRGDYKADVFSGRVEAGWRIVTQFVGVTPYAAGQAINYRMPNYQEQGNGAAGSFALGYASHDVTATRSEFGFRLDRSMLIDDASLTLRGRAAWAHNFDTARDAAATFANLPGTDFIVNGAAMAPEAALVSAGAEIGWRNGFALAATFEGEFSDNVTSYAGKGTVRYQW